MHCVTLERHSSTVCPSHCEVYTQSCGLLSNAQHPSLYSLAGARLTVAVQLSQNDDARSAETQKSPYGTSSFFTTAILDVCTEESFYCETD